MDPVVANKYEFEKLFGEYGIDGNVPKHFQDANIRLKNPIMGNKGKPDKKYFILRGVSGIGKSSVTKEIELLWASGNIFTDIKYLFHIACGEINNLKQSSFEELLKIQYPGLFDLIKFDDLRTIAAKVMIVVDGIDEFTGLNQFESLSTGSKLPTSELSITNCLYDMLSLKDQFVRQAYVIVTGRADACSIILQINRRNKKETKSFDLLGFTNEAVEKYIDAYLDNKVFEPNQDVRTIAANLKAELNGNDMLRAMTRIPVYLRIICDLYVKDQNFELPETLTELYILELESILKDHFAPHGCKDLPHKDYIIYVFENKEVKELLPSLAKMCHDMLKSNIEVLTDDMVSRYSAKKLILDTGMVMKIETPEGDMYKFFHSSLKEFLAAVHLLITSTSIKEIYESKEICRAFPFFCGLKGALLHNSTSPMNTKTFVKSLGLNLEEESITEFSDEFLQLQFPDGIHFLNCYNEYHNTLAIVYLKRLEIQCLSPIHLKHLFYFIGQEVGNIKVHDLSMVIPSKLCDSIKEEQKNKLVSLILKSNYVDLSEAYQVINTISECLLKELKAGKHSLNTISINENVDDFKWMTYIQKVVRIKVNNASKLDSLMTKLQEIQVSDATGRKLEQVYIYSNSSVENTEKLLEFIKRLQFVPHICLNLIRFHDLDKRFDIDKFEKELSMLATQEHSETRFVTLQFGDKYSVPGKDHTFNMVEKFHINNNGDVICRTVGGVEFVEYMLRNFEDTLRNLWVVEEY